MSSSCTPILMGVIPSVLEILLLLKMAKFPKNFNRLESGEKIHASRD